jgi:Xaa-Pro aminopeptidase
MSLPSAEEPASEARPQPAAAAPLDGFAPEEFQARRAALRAACADGLILIRGATEDEAAHASGGTYRQNSVFFYLTGVETPGAFLVLLPEGVPASAGLRDTPPDVRKILFLPARNPGRETWTGAQLGPGEETAKATGIAKVADTGSLWGALIGWLRRNPILYTLTPYGEGAKLTREYALMQRISDIAPCVQFRDCAETLSRLRVVKSPAELERIRQAIAITVEGQKAARALIAAGAGRWEYEVEAQIFATFRSRGAGLAFPTIVGAGVNGTVLHYEENRACMNAGDLVVVDIGARCGHYCGDLTRTYPVSGGFSERQREIYALVLEAHHRALTDYRPGEDTLKDITDRCKAFLKESPLRAHDADGKEQTMDTFMPHSLSHYLGLDVHDVGDRELPLIPGGVITIEPGIYIPAEGIGVRIEDDYLVTPTGLERLGPPLESDPDELLAAMRTT